MHAANGVSCIGSEVTFSARLTVMRCHSKSEHFAFYTYQDCDYMISTRQVAMYDMVHA